MFSSREAIWFWNSKGKDFLDQSLRRDSFYTRRQEVVESLVRAYSRPSRSLDIGSADGALVRSLYAMGYDAYGTDISSSMIGIAIERSREVLPSPGSRFRLTQGDTPPFLSQFDLLTAIGVLPYVNDHGAYIKYLDSMLAPNGVLILTCTSPVSLYNCRQILGHFLSLPPDLRWRKKLRHLLTTGIASGGFVTNTHGSHTRSSRSLRNLLCACGYNILDTVSLYNLSSLDKRPLNRGRAGLFLSHLLGWTHLVAARKTA